MTTREDEVQANLAFHEIWWIYSEGPDEWTGLRIAHFSKTTKGDMLVAITGEADRRRFGLRIWDDVKVREGWHKVLQITPPTREQIREALASQ